MFSVAAWFIDWNFVSCVWCVVVFCFVGCLWLIVITVYIVNKFTSCKPFCQVFSLYSQTQCGPSVGVKLFYLTRYCVRYIGLSAAWLPVSLCCNYALCTIGGVVMVFWGLPIRRNGYCYSISHTPLQFHPPPIFRTFCTQMKKR